VGGLLAPEAFMTATRQAAAQANGWSLESLQLVVTVLPAGTRFPWKPPPSLTLTGTAPSTEPQVFTLQGLTLEGPAWNFDLKHLAPNVALSPPLPAVQCPWRQKKDLPADAAACSVPVYLNEPRRDLLFSVDMRVPADQPAASWFQRMSMPSPCSPPSHL